MNCSDIQIPHTKSHFNQHNSSLDRHVNAMSTKSLEIQALSITKPRTHSEQKFECMNTNFQLCLIDIITS